MQPPPGGDVVTSAYDVTDVIRTTCDLGVAVGYICVSQCLRHKLSINAYEEDFLSAEKYRDKYPELCSQIEQLYLKDSSTKDFSEKRKLKLPKIELKKFDGDAKDYLTFWSQFRKIHEDSSIPNEDKCQYLLQAVVPKSKAARVVESFPATEDNYPKEIS
ncbi:hypothetical protein AVEN_57503-1 [Araneus ventricosus]|uniref:Uncharacterized protein n=1 Tax=Araneus ventricosus TaxID=182803 RepID=A0A4Y2D0B4_ARAVE|nr:hypothetical protein AVEN_57503-1 [Araneus ventricosus]